jgi:hypothetical protein
LIVSQEAPPQAVRNFLNPERELWVAMLCCGLSLFMGGTA